MSRKIAARGWRAVFALGLSLIGSTALAEPTFTPLFWFESGKVTDAQVWGPLAFSNNTLYVAGLSQHGVVFQLTPRASGKGLWAPTVLHDFTGDAGDSPYGGLLLMPAGPTATTQTIVGTTELDQGGTVFSLTAQANRAKPWTLSILHKFSAFNTPDRANPFSGMIADRLVSGRLLGVAPLGGPKSSGTVYALTPPAKAGGAWVETVLHRFNIKDGQAPEGPLLQDTDGTLYGTTKAGGKNYYGTVFQLTPPATAGGAWAFRTLYTFTGREDGGFPIANLVFDSARQHIFGVSGIAVTGQTGLVFRLTRPAAASGKWTYSLIHRFANDGKDGTDDSLDGATPGLVIDAADNLYGATVSGGMHGLGIVYKLSKPATENGTWTQTILHSFGGHPDGGYPFATLTLGPKGELYGTTTYGGPTGGYGGVFKITP